MVISMDRWIGKLAVVTGSASGIGKSISEALINAGLNVIGIDINSASNNNLASKLPRFTPYNTDISNPINIKAAFDYITENFGPLSILINSAVIGKETTLIDGDFNDWSAVFNVNVLALCQATKEAINIMRENNINGHVVHISSLLAYNIPDSYGKFNVYPASKHAVKALTETLRLELARIKDSLIKISSVSPGLVESGMNNNLSGMSSDKREFLSKGVFLKSEDVADCVIFILSTPPHVQVHDLMIRAIA